jgi:hypothetical protein
VVLVEGKTRIAQIIKYLTQSSWSHSTLYVGDRLANTTSEPRTCPWCPRAHPDLAELTRAHSDLVNVGDSLT